MIRGIRRGLHVGVIFAAQTNAQIVGFQVQLTNEQIGTAAFPPHSAPADASSRALVPFKYGLCQNRLKPTTCGLLVNGLLVPPKSV